MFCKYCGSKLVADNAAFCHECGKATYEQPVMPVQQPVAPVQPVPVQPVPVQQPVPAQLVQPVPPVQQAVPVQSVYPQPVYAPPAPPAQPAYQVPVYQQPAQYTYTVPPVHNTPEKPAVDPTELEVLEKKALTHGILALSLCMLGLPGIIFGSIGTGKANSYKKLAGSLSNKARAGHKMAKAGKIVGIIMTVLLGILVPTIIEEGILNDINPMEPFEYFDY